MEAEAAEVTLGVPEADLALGVPEAETMATEEAEVSPQSPTETAAPDAHPPLHSLEPQIAAPVAGQKRRTKGIVDDWDVDKELQGNILSLPLLRRPFSGLPRTLLSEGWQPPQIATPQCLLPHTSWLSWSVSPSRVKICQGSSKRGCICFLFFLPLLST